MAIERRKKPISYSQIIDKQQINVFNNKFNGKFQMKILDDIISFQIKLFQILRSSGILNNIIGY